MGDRAMAEIVTDGGSIYVYTHWGGRDLPTRAKQAIKFAEGRWDDRPYSTRIIVDQLTKASRDSLTGHGLLLDPHAEDEYNNDNPSVVINLLDLTLVVVREGATATYEFADLPTWVNNKPSKSRRQRRP